MKPAPIALVWLGIILGVSFIATPIKFTAPSLDLPTAREVGRVTFRLLARIEWGLGILLCVSALAHRQRLPWSAVVLLLGVVVESLVLLPALGARTDIIRAGGTPAPSHLHDLFILAEVLEILALGHIALVTSRTSPA